jgi:hypothetical protein
MLVKVNEICRICNMYTFALLSNRVLKSQSLLPAVNIIRHPFVLLCNVDSTFETVKSYL